MCKADVRTIAETLMNEFPALVEDANDWCIEWGYTMNQLAEWTTGECWFVMEDRGLTAYDYDDLLRGIAVAINRTYGL